MRRFGFHGLSVAWSVDRLRTLAGTLPERVVVCHLGSLGLGTEISYKNGSPVERGTPGSVRLDAVDGPVDAPTAVYDLKTGSAKLTPARIRQIRANLPPGSRNIPILEVR